MRDPPKNGMKRMEKKNIYFYRNRQQQQYNQKCVNDQMCIVYCSIFTTSTVAYMHTVSEQRQIFRVLCISTVYNLQTQWLIEAGRENEINNAANRQRYTDDRLSDMLMCVWARMTRSQRMCKKRHVRSLRQPICGVFHIYIMKKNTHTHKIQENTKNKIKYGAECVMRLHVGHHSVWEKPVCENKSTTTEVQQWNECISTFSNGINKCAHLNKRTTHTHTHKHTNWFNRYNQTHSPRS